MYKIIFILFLVRCQRNNVIYNERERGRRKEGRADWVIMYLKISEKNKVINESLGKSVLYNIIHFIQK